MYRFHVYLAYAFFTGMTVIYASGHPNDWAIGIATNLLVGFFVLISIDSLLQLAESSRRHPASVAALLAAQAVRGSLMTLLEVSFGTAINQRLVTLEYTRSLPRDQLDARMSTVLREVLMSTLSPIHPPQQFRDALAYVAGDLNQRIDVGLSAYLMYHHPDIINTLTAIKGAGIPSTARVFQQLRDHDYTLPEEMWRELIQLYNQLTSQLQREAARLMVSNFDPSPRSFLQMNEQPGRYPTN